MDLRRRKREKLKLDRNEFVKCSHEQVKSCEGKR